MRVTFIFLAALFISNFSHATIRRVCYIGSPLAGVDYSDFALAYNASAAGDTLQIYGNITVNNPGVIINKKIIIEGFGYNFDVNSNLYPVSSDAPSKFLGNQILTFAPGSENSVLEGCVIVSEGGQSTFISIATSNITVRRCCIDIVLQNNLRQINNTKIESCVVNYLAEQSSQSYPTINTQILNCILSTGQTNIRSAASTGTIVNSVEIPGSSTSGLSFGNATFVVKNSVLFYYTASLNTTWQNCFFREGQPAQLLTGNNNRWGQDYGILFKRLGGNSDVPGQFYIVKGCGYGCDGIINLDFAENYYQLKANSSAINGGFASNGNPTDCGIFGGDSVSRYKLGGVPAIPSIYKLSAYSPEATANFFKVIISVRSNAKQNIARLEYYIDNDPGYGNGTSVNITPAIEIDNLSVSPDISSLSPGPHKIHLRAKDENGTWSLVNSADFTVRSQGPPGNTLSFDGLNDYVSIPHNSLLKPSAQITIEAWVKPVNIHTNRYYEIYRKEDGSARHLLSFQEFGTVLSFGLQVGANYTELDVPIVASRYEGQWVHIAATFDGSTKKIYRNGELIGTENITGSINTTGTSPGIIGSSSGASEFFYGNIDELRIWSIARTAAQIQSAMLAPILDSPAGLIVNYNFDIGLPGGTNTGLTTLADLSAHQINGSLNNFALTGGVSNWVESYAMVLPTALPAINTSVSGFTAKWNPPLVGDVTTYLLDVSTDSSFNSVASGYNALNVGSATTFDVTGVAPNTNYYYRVRADKISVSGQGAFSKVIHVFTSGKSKQTIVFDTITDKIYGDISFTVNAVASSGLAISYNIISGPASVTNNIVTVNGAGVVTVRATQSGNGTYNAVSADRTFNVQKASATITLSNLNYTYDGNPKTPASVTSPAGLKVNYLYDSVYSPPVNAGNYKVIATINDSNYSGRSTDTLRIQKADQTITLAATADKEYGTQPFVVQATATSGLPVTLTLNSNPANAASLSGNTVSIQNIGTVIINASQTGNSNYNSAPSIADTFNINKGNQQITFNALPDVTIDSATVLINATVNSGLPLTYTVNTIPTTGVASLFGNIINILGDTGRVIVRVSQSGNSYYNPVQSEKLFKVSGRPQTITFPPITTKTFGDSSFHLNATASSLLPVTYAIVSGSAFINGNLLTVTGAGLITIEVNQAGNSKIYKAPPVRQTFTVTKATQTISIDSIADKIFGDAPFNITSQATSGLPVNFNVVSGNAVLSNSNTLSITGAGNVVIRATQNGNQNYLPETALRRFCIAPIKPRKIYGFKESCISTQKYYIDTIPGSTYTWSISGGGSLLSATGSNISVTWTNTGMHRLSVKANNVCNNNGTDTTILDVEVVNPSAPAEATNLFPANSTVIATFPLSLSWQASGLSEQYDLYIWPDGTPQPSTPSASNLQDVAYVINSAKSLPGFAAGKKYNWKVVTKNACRQSIGVTNYFFISDLPNLVLQSVLAPDTTFSGTPIDITMTLLNNGKVSTRSTRWSDAVYLSSDGIFDPSDIYIGGANNLSSLDVSQQYASAFRVNLPQNIIGNYRLFMITNNNGSLTESSRFDDTIIKPIFIRLTPPPDLQVTSVITPSEAFSGQFINVSYKVKNKGAGETNAKEWYDYIYISPEPFFDKNSAVKISEYKHLQDGPIQITHLLPDSSYSNTVNMALPSKFFGNYYIFVETDAKDNVYEFSFNNNNTNRNDSLTIFLTPPPDFVVTDFTPPSTVNSQEIATINYKVQNKGATAPPATDRKWLDAIYISKDSLFDIRKAKLLDFTLPYTRPFYRECLSAGNGGASSGGSSSGRGVISGNINFGGLFNSGNAIAQEYCNTQSLSNIQYYNGYSETEGNYIGSNGCGQTSFYPNMIAEEIYSNNISAIIPDTLSGTYYLHLYTDVSNTVFEFQQENNNTKSSKIIIGNPDIIIDSINISDSVASGTSVNLSWTIKNQGTGKVFDKNRKDLFWLTNSSIYNRSNMILVDSLTYCTAIANSATITKQKSIKIPDGLSGTYYLFVETDFDKNIYEGNNEGNNYLSKPLKINLTPAPDLRMNFVHVSTDTVEFDQDFTLDYNVSNIGQVGITGKPWKDFIYISRPITGVDSARGYKATEIFRAQSLDTNASYAVTNTVGIDQNTVNKAGFDSIYYVYALADGNNAIYEHNSENNNIARNKLFVRSSDLAVTAVTGSLSVFSGQSATLSWSVANVGGRTGSFSNNWSDNIYLSTDTVFDANDKLLGGNVINGPVLHNGTYSQTITYQLPDGFSGKYYLFVTADDQNTTKDRNRANNINTIRDINGVPQPINITLTPSPDLIVSSLQVPSIGYTGQPITINWQVKNAGVGPTRTGGWKEQVYLVTNPKSQSGLYLGSYNRNGNLSQDSAYSDSLRVFIPEAIAGNYYLLFVTDDPSQVFEYNAENNNTSAKPIFIIRPQPSDLVVTDIALSSQAILGDSITVTWKVKNIGLNPAAGYFTQGIYLSADSSWNVDDMLLLNPADNVFISPLNEELFSKRVKIKGLKEGKFFGIVRTDLTNNIYESDEANNTGVSIDTIRVSIHNLPLNVLTPDILYSNNEMYYKLTISDSLQGETVLISLGSNTLITPNELYMGFGEVPTRATYDYKYDNANSGNQEILIPAVRSGSYYILLYNGSNLSQQNISLLAQKISFSIRSINTNEGGNTGLVTIRIRGAKFEPNMQIILKNNSSGSIDATSVQYINSTTVFATFNLAGRPVGSYDVVARKPNADTTSLPGGFRIIPGSGGGFQGGGVTPGGFYCSIKNIGVDELLGTDFQYPGTVLLGRRFTMSINFGNSGNVDIPLPARVLVSIDGLPVGLTQDELSEGKKQLYLEFKEANGPEGILRPGATGAIIIYSVGTSTGEKVFRLLE